MARLSAALAAFAILALAAAAGDACSAGSQGVCRDALADSDTSLELLQVGASTAGRRVGLDALSTKAYYYQYGYYSDLQVDASAAERRVGLDALSTEAEGPSAIAGQLTGEADRTEQFPGFDIGGIAGSVNSVVGAIPGLSSATGALAELATRILASSVQDTLGSVGAEAGSLLSKTRGYRAGVLRVIADANSTYHDQVAALEQAVNSTVGEYLPQWTRIADSVNTTAGIVIMSLNMAGQSDAASKVSGVLDEAMGRAAAIAEGLSGASGLVANLSEMASEEASARLLTLNATLEVGLAKAGEFGSSLDGAFADMLNRAADALAQVVPGADAAALRASFAPLVGQEAEIGKKLVDSIDVLLSGIGEAVASTEALLLQSAGSRASSAVAFGVAAVAAVLAL